MTNPTIRIHDIETNEVIDRELTDAEFAELEAQAALEAEDSEEDSESRINSAKN